MLYVEKGEPAHAFELAFKLRQIDMFEVAMMGHDPLHALVTPFRFTRKGVKTYTVLKNNEVLAMFGVVTLRNNPKRGSVWMLSSQKLDDDWLYFTKRTKKWVDYFLAEYDYVHNYISEENKTAIKWLKWLGFTFNPNKIIVKGKEVLYFYKKIQGVSGNIQPVLEDLGPKWITEDRLKVDNC